MITVNFKNKFNPSPKVHAAIVDHLRSLYGAMYAHGDFEVVGPEYVESNVAEYSVYISVPSITIVNGKAVVTKLNVELCNFTANTLAELLPDDVVADDVVVDQRLTTMRQKLMEVKGMVSVYFDHQKPWKLVAQNTVYGYTHKANFGKDVFVCSEVEFERRVTNMVNRETEFMLKQIGRYRL